jgi:UDP-GlcNAc:undecaprenyl-phosphate/decaprenyl-phosphate GlcNAc-1-phosphate transferase
VNIPFPIGYYAAAFLAGAVIAWSSLPAWCAWCRHMNLVDDPGHRKIHTTPTPLAGGLAVLTGVIVPLIAALFFAVGTDSLEAFTYGFGQRALQLSAIVGGAIGMLLLGLLDDRIELNPPLKFTGQLAIALMVAAAGVRITLFVGSPIFSYGITILWILTVTNAVNFMDNMNGLCGGIGAIGSLLFGLHASAKGQYLVAALAFLIAGATGGFLPHNYPKASAFLGDSGSHLVGYLLAVMAIAPHFYTAKTPNRFAVFSPLLVLAVPLIDLLNVVVFRTLKGRPFWVGDTNHLSHRLVRAGLSKPVAVGLLWLAGAISGLLSFLL